MAIDLNTVEEEEEDEPVERSATGVGTVCLDLWYACAGPLISLPSKGSVMVYLPQGHMEVLGNGGGGMMMHCDVPPHVFCRVVDVQLRADAVTDIVYAQLSLVAESKEALKQFHEGNANREGDELNEMNSGGDSPPLHMFCKKLTASDTSTHGGFSVPCRAAEDCFPPLDYEQQRPSQELVAKDLHGVEWKFRHIYRGQPRRHLLTTGWSAFVNNKKLVSGDAVLFLREDDGMLRLGIRRATQLKGKILRQIHASQFAKFGFGTLSSLASTVSKGKIFQVNYNPRINQSEFIMPYWKFIKSCDYSFSVGSRFKMRFESEDAADRRCSGLITGISDLDPIRWPGSKWKCFVVRWDGEDVDRGRPNRVSPWEIEPFGSLSGSNNLCPPGSKRIRIGIASVNAGYTYPSGSGGHSDLGESARFNKVLQGQEILPSKTRRVGNATPSHRTLEQRRNLLPETRRCFANPESGSPADSGGFAGDPHGNSGFFYQGMGFGESFGFHKVLQGQEIVPVNRTSQVSSPSSVLSFQQSTSQLLFSHSYYAINEHGKAEDCDLSGTLSSVDSCSQSHQPGHCISRDHCESGLNSAKTLESDDSIHTRSSGSSCMLFGISLTENIPPANPTSGSLKETPLLPGEKLEFSL